jgi:hypothetical protein
MSEVTVTPRLSPLACPGKQNPWQPGSLSQPQSLFRDGTLWSLSPQSFPRGRGQQLKRWVCGQMNPGGLNCLPPPPHCVSAPELSRCTRLALLLALVPSRGSRAPSEGQRGQGPRSQSWKASGLIARLWPPGRVPALSRDPPLGTCSVLSSLLILVLPLCDLGHADLGLQPQYFHLHSTGIVPGVPFFPSMPTS